MRMWLLSSNCLGSALEQKVRAYGEKALSRRGRKGRQRQSLGGAKGAVSSFCGHSQAEE